MLFVNDFVEFRLKITEKNTEQLKKKFGYLTEKNLVFSGIH